MRRAISLAGLFARVSIQNFAAYRFDLAARFCLSVIHLTVELLMVWVIFSNTTNVRGWRWQHMLVLTGVYRLVAGGIRLSIVPNMRRLMEDIHRGTFDFVLMRPVSSQLLVSIREWVLWRVADVALGLAVIAYACGQLGSAVSPVTLAGFLLLLAAGFVIVYAIWLMMATICFWIVKISNIEMIFWNVFEAGRYPVGVFRPWIRTTLTFVIPLAFITTIPASSLLGTGQAALGHAPYWALVVAVGLFTLATLLWRQGLRRYAGASA